MVMQAVMRLNKPVTFINTGTVLDADVSFYALTKQQFSHCGRFLAAQCPCQLRFINVLLQHMYGSGDSQTKFTTRVLRACYRNEFSLELTSGEQKRDFIYIDDVVSAYSTLIEQRAKFSNIEDIEVGSGTASTIREFVDIVHNATASRTLLRFGALPYRRNEPMFLQADISKIKALGWHPEFDLELGVRRTLELEFDL
jgi:nucleoside-diphosphate-sugar epimerase